MRWAEINEARQAPLYHMMMPDKWAFCALHDEMPARWEHKIVDQGMVKGNSFTRNPRFNYGDRPVRLIMDQQALAARHKMIPLDGERTFRDTHNYPVGNMSDRVVNSRGHGQDRALSEEFVVGDIKPLSRYVAAIELPKPDFYHMTGADAIRLLESVQEYCSKHGVEARIAPEFIENVEYIKQRWADEEAEENERYHAD